ncbi:hypothetical protein [Heyndrickxia oleronia]|uniref:hypothetical protein n=1 Tax=Heyndrickxia oleronia TaxID=38875 RepID=UPI001B2561A2|nr:hypothetical protein [Heyndrickxia oleronia]GIN39021.1 hypothetical protein J19TS1_19700 [Heyndrickxia oleronia]
MKKMILTILLSICLVGCSPYQKLKLHDIEKYGLGHESDKLHKLGILGLGHGDDGTIHFYVKKIEPNTREKIDQGLIDIFGMTIEYELHEISELQSPH